MDAIIFLVLMGIVIYGIIRAIKTTSKKQTTDRLQVLNVIVRHEHANRISKTSLPITGIPDENKERAKTILSENAAKGANPKDVYGKVAKALEPFEWPEFDKWVKIFREAGEWPALWDDISDYYIAVDHEPVRELLYRLNKTKMLQLAKAKGLILKKTLKKEAILAEIAAVISEDDKPAIQQSIWPDGEKSLHKAKSGLMAHTVSMGYSIKELKQQYNEPGEQIEVSPASDCCSWCAKHEGKIYRVATIKQENLPPFHPACRCSVRPVAD